MWSARKHIVEIATHRVIMRHAHDDMNRVNAIVEEVVYQQPACKSLVKYYENTSEKAHLRLIKEVKNKAKKVHNRSIAKMKSDEARCMGRWRN